MTLRLNSISVNAQYIQLPAMWLLYAMQAGVIGFIIYELIRILRKRISANRKTFIRYCFVAGVYSAVYFIVYLIPVQKGNMNTVEYWEYCGVLCGNYPIHIILIIFLYLSLRMQLS